MMLLAPLILSLLCVPAAQAQDLVTLGQAEAREHCARCHPALGGARASRAEAQRMRGLAQAADPRAQLAVMLEKGHAGLSAELFSQAELGALAAYISARRW